MNPAMIIIVGLVAVIGWFLAARFFSPTGKVVKDVIDEAVYEMTKEDIELNENGNNTAIKVHILDTYSMRTIGFKWVPTLKEWYFCKPVYKNHITFNMSIKSENNWRIDVLDEAFCQPYDYQAMYDRGDHRPVVLTVMENVNEIMDTLKEKGIISGWNVGDYI